MSYKKFIDEYLSKRLIERQHVGEDQINKIINQARKEIDSGMKILDITRELAYTSAYSGMLYAARAYSGD